MDIWHLKLEFLSPIRHNLATHEGSENIVVKVTTDDGVAGFGEGIPRSFVTGELMSESLSFLQKVLGPAVLGQKLGEPQEVVQTLADLYRETTVRSRPAAFCAVEMAILDAAGCSLNLPLAEFIGPQVKDRVTYSAVIPMVSQRQLGRFLDLVKMNQMQFLKLKVGAKSDLDMLKLAREKLGWEVDIRVDANAAWSAPEAIKRIQEMTPYRISAVEQPVAKEDFAGMKIVSDAVDPPLIADESLCHEEDARRLIDLGACRIFNLRLSKCGGLGAATRIRRLAEQAGMRCQLGCHVGESSILSAAGRHFALCSPHLEYVEGSFSPFLLSRDPVRQPVTFEFRGLATGLPGPGLGLEVDSRVLEELALAHHVLD